ncbi:hypothetical protein ACFVR6_00570 [Microbacterium sp. NPDC058021]|uniref:hypothetical protein n=1 Tax=Microbacterium sp. NPDC058021 TaxID=3346306 RepID=UPI0036DE81FA
MTMPAASVPFDARPLLDPVDDAEAGRLAADLRRTGRAPGGLTGGALVGVIVLGLVALFILPAAFQTLFAVVTFTTGGPDVAEVAFASVVLLVLLGGAVVGGILLIRSGRRAQARRWFRLDRFARANGMRYVPRLTATPLPGMIFGLGSARQATDLVRGEEPRFVEFGNYQYTTGSGKNRTTHKWGYIAVKLDIPLPHIVLDATGNNSLFGSNLPLTFDKDQRLGLEGDFDRYFALYCPAGYERDALYLFTPDVMARFIDNAAALDVEIVDDWLFLYSKRELSTTDPATWAWLFGAVAAVLGKLDQWERWRDDRLRGAAVGAAAPAPGPTAPPAAAAGQPVAASLPFQAPTQLLRPPPGVAPQGRRLARGIPWVTIVAVSGIVLVWILQGLLRAF